ncbi:MAG: metallophosphoesterase [Gemmatimonadetes bacterium]|nr:metallophosphoesterase [Gemmatimonadota bacterium]
MISAAVFCLALLSSTVAWAHEGPDPLGSWDLNSNQIDQDHVQALLGVNGQIEGVVKFVDDTQGNGLFFDGKTTRVTLAEDLATSEQELPGQHLTVAAWVAVNTPQSWGGILGVLQDNADVEQGWILGYNGQVFTFGLASKQADDGDGMMTYLAGRTPYEIGRYYHVVATYDGSQQRLYVNGQLDGSSSEQGGDILYPSHAPLVLGGYRDADEDYFHHGRIRSVRLFGQAASQKWVQDSFSHAAELTDEKPHVWVDPEHRWVVHPYLQWPTRNSMTIRWETTWPSNSIVEYGEAVSFSGKGNNRTAQFSQKVATAGPNTMHEVRLTDLRQDQAHYYRVTSVDARGRTLQSPVLSFQTAPSTDTPFAFCIISDTQGNPTVNGKIANLAWAQRPSFVLHPGDLVSTGSIKAQWVDEFFGSMKPLFERVALIPVLGNHEQDARFYYDYMSLPDPEYYYTYRYGNAQFFLIDSNRKVEPDSEQYQWLQKELEASTATWKIVSYHHPAYSSDENDYGDTWSGPSTRGDLRVRELVPLFDTYGVDIVWNGHIHSYERTWPLRENRATTAGNGTIYMITGGGGGPLETPGPIRPWFQNNVRRGHHYCMVAINGTTLELKSFGLEGQLFDHLTITK